MTTLFSCHIEVKMLNCSSVLMLFVLLILLIGMPFALLFLFGKQRNVQFYSKCKNNLRGSVFLMVEFGLYNFVLGSIHILTEKRLNFQLFCLFLAETFFIAYLITNFGHNTSINVYLSKFDTFVTILALF
jgi:hypothetical protein